MRNGVVSTAAWSFEKVGLRLAHAVAGGRLGHSVNPTDAIFGFKAGHEFAVAHLVHKAAGAGKQGWARVLGRFLQNAEKQCGEVGRIERKSSVAQDCA